MTFVKVKLKQCDFCYMIFGKSNFRQKIAIKTWNSLQRIAINTIFVKWSQENAKFVKGSLFRNQTLVAKSEKFVSTWRLVVVNLHLYFEWKSLLYDMLVFGDRTNIWFHFRFRPNSNSCWKRIVKKSVGSILFILQLSWLLFFNITKCTK